MPVRIKGWEIKVSVGINAGGACFIHGDPSKQDDSTRSPCVMAARAGPIGDLWARDG
jgi:hypothetical protein